MAITLAPENHSYDQGSRISSFKVKFTLSSSYSTGGETVDLSSSALSKMKIRNTSKIRAVWVNSNNGVNYNFIWEGLALNACKLKVFTAANTELGAGAYSATYTGDTPYMVFEYLKD